MRDIYVLVCVCERESGTLRVRRSDLDKYSLTHTHVFYESDTCSLFDNKGERFDLN